MGRSNFPIGDSSQSGSSKLLDRSATTTTTTRVPDPKTQHHIKLPHPHIPFLHRRDAHTQLPSGRPSNVSASNTRPPALNRQNSVQTRYVEMLLSLDMIPRLHNIMAAFFTWILLAGFLVFPGTFTSIASLDDDPNLRSQAAAEILSKVKHVSLLIVAGVCSGIGALGMVYLWRKWRNNYVWLLNKIFLPGCLNSFAGLISTLINVYSQQSGNWSITAKVTAIVTGSSMVVTGVLFILYNFIVLGRVKKRHERDMSSQHLDETVVEKIERKVHEPALEPGSVV